MNLKNNIKKFFKAVLSVIFLFILAYSIIDLFRGEENEPIVEDTASPTPYILTEPNPIKITSDPIGGETEIENGKIYGIDEKNGNLLIFENGRSSVVYSGTVMEYTVKGNVALVVDSKNPAELIIINPDNKTQKRATLNDYSPIISLALSDDLKTIYFLGSFSITNKTPVLYSMSVDELKPNKITETRALEVSFFDTDRIILFEDVHEEDQSVVHVFSFKENRNIFSQTANFYKFSPDKKNLLLQTSNSLTIIDSINLTINQTFIIRSNNAIWKDNNTILAFRNTNSGTEMSVLTLNPYTNSKYILAIENDYIKNLYGTIANNLYFQNYKQEIKSVKLK